ncbi:DUF916 and DUF3324 domain-containing protein [Enterococcus caccae]|uniref:Uncharacterized protein n=1 Tax=Enterococcus caccae ATCC BAA-1240 TaxID=1158612 RepID=R3TP94_9ENTE|nr:DUF916 and DUF3324 domain-containing protein [Enterococcus caccae]EOL42873.1 hypothetical protein UC7_03281 [Enterococcus caccae ATCC BAA-1240]EOT67648.1 hypothetical protein I580_00030 [Enterococcus caccae ATCC BAA-1240]
MNMRISKLGFAIILLLLFLSSGIDGQASEINFNVKAILPENQRSKEVSYFDLRVVPGEKQILSVELINDTQEDVTIQASANSAITNDNGIVDYSYSDTKKDSSAAFTFSEIAKMPKNIVLPKKSSKIMECIVEIPEESFDGYVLGGLYFEQKGEAEEKSKGALAVGNRFSYVVGVLLSETDKEVKPELALNKVQATQLNGNNAVIMNLQNKKPAMVKKLQLDAKLYYENETKPRYENHQESLAMAPNTNFNYKIDLKEQPFIAGNYTVKIKANDGYKDWTWEKTFVIKEKEAKKYNATAINLPPNPKLGFPWTLVISIGAGILVVILGIIYYFNQKLKKEQQKQHEKYEELKKNLDK